jgi:hypothetical protein
MAALQAPGGAPFGPQTGGSTTPTATQQPGLFSPKIANHSLPYGYQSAFPNSLSDEDKRLLYAQLLNTGAA